MKRGKEGEKVKLKGREVENCDGGREGESVRRL